MQKNTFKHVSPAAVVVLLSGASLIVCPGCGGSSPERQAYEKAARAFVASLEPVVKAVKTGVNHSEYTQLMSDLTRAKTEFAKQHGTAQASCPSHGHVTNHAQRAWL